MRIWNKIFILILLTCGYSAYAIDISNVSNPLNFQQTSHSQKYTIGSDGVSLFHNRKDTGMRLSSPSSSGSITVIDNSIPKKPRSPRAGGGTPGGGTGGAGGGTSGGTGGAGGGTSGGTGGAGGGTPGGGTGGAGGGTSGGTGGAGGGTSGGTGGAGGGTSGGTGGAGGGTSGGTGGAGGGGTGGTGGKTGGIKANAGRVAGGALGAVGLATGTMGVIDSVSGTDEHSWGNVLEGTLSGATAAAGGAAIINAIPGVGQVGYGAAILTGAVIGGLISGSQLFSETDCLPDPITGQFTCCNTVFNSGNRQVPIGGYMFCGNSDNQAIMLGVRQCLQGGQDTEAGWWDGMWEDDEWSKECTVRLCPGESEIATGTPTESIVPIPDPEQICWKWECADGYTQTGNTCVSNTNTPGANNGTSGGAQSGQTSVDAYDILIQKIQQQIQQLQEECGGVL